MNNLEKEFIPYNQALALKELGFNEPCFANYTVILEDEIDWFTIPEQGITDKTSFGSSKNYNSKSFEEEGTISAPTFSQAFRWFREKYGLEGIIAPRFHRYDSLRYVFETISIYTVPRNILNDNLFKGIFEMYYTYEDAELECLKKLIEIVKNK